jgi:hypothetical protein
MDLIPSAIVGAPQGFAGHERARAAAALRVEAGLGLALIPAFWALDWMVMPAKVAPLFAIRAVPTVAAAALLALSIGRPAALARHALPLGFGFSWLVAASITAMCFLHNGYESPYYAGINLVVMFVGLLYSWPVWLSLAFAALVQGTYMAPLLLGIACTRRKPCPTSSGNSVHAAPR